MLTRADFDRLEAQLEAARVQVVVLSDDLDKTRAEVAELAEEREWRVMLESFVENATDRWHAGHIGGALRDLFGASDEEWRKYLTHTRDSSPPTLSALPPTELDALSRKKT